MFFSDIHANKELWEFCKMEYKNDPEFAYLQYTESKTSLLERIKNSLSPKLTSSSAMITSAFFNTFKTFI